MNTDDQAPANHAAAAVVNDEERRLQVAWYRFEFGQISVMAANCARSSSTDPADWRADMKLLIERAQRFMEV